MSRDEALQKWLDENNFNNMMNLSMGAASRAAWKAGVKHTLAFVAGKLNEKANKLNQPDSLNERDAQLVRNLADFIMKFEP